MSHHPNNHPLWLVFSLVLLGALITFIAYMIQVDEQTDEIRVIAEPIVEVEIAE